MDSLNNTREHGDEIINQIWVIIDIVKNCLSIDWKALEILLSTDEILNDVFIVLKNWKLWIKPDSKILHAHIRGGIEDSPWVPILPGIIQLRLLRLANQIPEDKKIQINFSSVGFPWDEVIVTKNKLRAKDAAIAEIKEVNEERDFTKNIGKTITYKESELPGYHRLQQEPFGFVDKVAIENGVDMPKGETHFQWSFNTKNCLRKDTHWNIPLEVLIESAAQTGSVAISPFLNIGKVPTTESNGRKTMNTARDFFTFESSTCNPTDIIVSADEKLTITGKIIKLNLENKKDKEVKFCYMIQNTKWETILSWEITGTITNMRALLGAYNKHQKMLKVEERLQGIKAINSEAESAVILWGLRDIARKVTNLIKKSNNYDIKNNFESTTISTLLEKWETFYMSPSSDYAMVTIECLKRTGLENVKLVADTIERKDGTQLSLWIEVTIWREKYYISYDESNNVRIGQGNFTTSDYAIERWDYCHNTVRIDAKEITLDDSISTLAKRKDSGLKKSDNKFIETLTKRHTSESWEQFNKDFPMLIKTPNIFIKPRTNGISPASGLGMTYEKFKKIYGRGKYNDNNVPQDYPLASDLNTSATQQDRTVSAQNKTDKAGIQSIQGDFDTTFNKIPGDILTKCIDLVMDAINGKSLDYLENLPEETIKGMRNKLGEYMVQRRKTKNDLKKKFFLEYGDQGEIMYNFFEQYLLVA